MKGREWYLEARDVENEKMKIWTKDFILITMTAFFVYLVFYLLMTTLTVYAMEEFSVSNSHAGFVSSIFVIGALASRLLIGKYIDHMSRKRLIFAGLSLYLIFMLAYFVVDNIYMLFLVRLLHGAAMGVSATTLATAIQDIIPSERRGEGTGYYTLSTILATAAGPFIGLLITQYYSFTIVFVVCMVFSIICLIIPLFANFPDVNTNSEQLRTSKIPMIKGFFEIKALPISIIAAFIGFAFVGILTFLSSYSIELNIVNASSFFFIVYTTFVLISRPFTGRLLDVKGDNLVIYPALILFTIGLIILSQTEHGFTLLLSGALIGLGYGTLISSLQTIVIKVSPQDRKGLATSTFFAFLDGGAGISPLLTGFLVPIVGFRGLYFTLAIIVFIGLVLYYFLHGKQRTTKKLHSHAM